ncbi:hypothetical protein GGS23DRAFT_613535 [Durotheca rogersii]|uniref:uncharacterized protein n=1 Tax=Durotheca rogersii TaxID=419775 RepID=UPI00221F46AC|nr:uncharacterized protein GGS23DRAFT_613535 [Durotheca rogersii]KAI5860664.1 hypothetical protein GGS23DRAFT_613535 [Durotheca rogersii]
MPSAIESYECVTCQHSIRPEDRIPALVRHLRHGSRHATPGPQCTLCQISTDGGAAVALLAIEVAPPDALRQGEFLALFTRLAAAGRLPTPDPEWPAVWRRVAGAVWSQRRSIDLWDLLGRVVALCGGAAGAALVARRLALHAYEAAMAEEKEKWTPDATGASLDGQLRTPRLARLVRTALVASADRVQTPAELVQFFQALADRNHCARLCHNYRLIR